MIIFYLKFSEIITSILGNNINNGSFANSNNGGVLLRPPTNSRFNDERITTNYRAIGAPAISWGAVIAKIAATAATSLLLIYWMCFAK